MRDDNLIRMANQIGAFFESMPDRGEAKLCIVQHLKKFWEPRMRKDFLAKLDAGVHGISDIVVEAVKLHRTLIE